MRLSGAEQLWSSWAVPRLMFFGWLVLTFRCWTSYRLQSLGNVAPRAYSLCLQEPKCIHRLIVQCSRTIWFQVFNHLDWGTCWDWWTHIITLTGGVNCKELNPLTIFTTNCIWQEWNQCTFRNIYSLTFMVTNHLCNKWRLWLVVRQKT